MQTAGRDRAQVTPFDELTARSKAAWRSGDFTPVAVGQVHGGEGLVRAVDIHPGERVLDVAAGTGNTALAAARRGARVLATDFVPELLEAAKRRAQAEGLELAVQEADAQALPFDDESFDVVLSTFGVMFAPDQQRTAAELVRVVRSRGRIGMANWTPSGLIGSIQAITARYVPPPPVPGLRSPQEWGTEARVRELFGDRVSEVRTRTRATDICGTSAGERVEFNRTHLGPTRVAFERLDRDGQMKLAAELTDELERFNRATDGTLVAAAEYLEVAAVRAGDERTAR